MFFRRNTVNPDLKNEITEKNGIVIDCRTAPERAMGMVPGAISADWLGGELHSKIKSLDPSKHYYLYCRSGARSGQATSFLKSHGFANATNLGGYDDIAHLF
ncbi:MAG: hypothetical protein RL226_1303 [Bacteroidota bacterium]|jgi:rhodanese-related sulfurtransferase